MRLGAAQFTEVVRQVNLLWSRRVAGGGRASPRGVFIAAGTFLAAMVVMTVVSYQMVLPPILGVVERLPEELATELRVVSLLTAALMTTPATVPNLLQRPATTDLGTLLRMLPVDRRIVTQALSLTQSLASLVMSGMLSAPMLAAAVLVTPAELQAAVLTLGMVGVVVCVQLVAVAFSVAEGTLRRLLVPLHLARTLAAATTFLVTAGVLGPALLVVALVPGAATSTGLDAIAAVGAWWIAVAGLPAIVAAWQVRAVVEAWSQEGPLSSTLRTGAGWRWPSGPWPVALVVETLALLRAAHVVSPLLFMAGGSIVIAGLTRWVSGYGGYWLVVAPSLPIVAALGGVHAVGLSQKWRWQRRLLGGLDPRGWALATMTAHLTVTAGWSLAVMPLAVWAAGQPEVAPAVIASLPTVLLAAVASLVTGALIVSPPEEPISALTATVAALPLVVLPSVAGLLVPGGGTWVSGGVTAALVLTGLLLFPWLAARDGTPDRRAQG